MTSIEVFTFTSSNVLFSGLQETVAELNGLPESTITAAQSARGAIGNAIAPANVVLGDSTGGFAGRKAKSCARRFRGRSSRPS